MTTQNTEAALEHLVSFQGAEIRQFILTEINKIAKIEKIDVNALAISIDTVTKILEANKQGLSLLNGLVEGNKLEIGKAKEELKTLIATAVNDNKTYLIDLINKGDKQVTDGLTQISNNITSQIAQLGSSIDTQIKDLAKKGEIDTGLLCDMFSKSLWNYTNFVQVETTDLGFVTPDDVAKGNVSKLFLKLSGDHFNPKSAAFDVSEQGSPFIKVIINGETILTQQIKAVKMFNQFEVMNLTVKKIKTIELVFVTDAYEGGTDKNSDGISEDRNLYVFEADVDGVSIKPKLTFKNNNTVTPFAECLYSQCSLSGNL